MHRFLFILFFILPLALNAKVYILDQNVEAYSNDMAYEYISSNGLKLGISDPASLLEIDRKTPCTRPWTNRCYDP